MIRSCAAVAALLVVVSNSASARDLDPTSQKVLRDYALSLPKVRAYDAATTALHAATASDAGLKADYDAASSEHTQTIDDEFGKMSRHPRIFAFYAKQGLSKQDAILIPMTLMSACMVVQYPSAAAKLSDRTSPAQVAFCKQNIGTLKTMKFFQGG